ncbi:hypothetical protein MMH89_00740 [Candidatus Comchoanobacter bicostacola]|uniref:Uncharacterized protein n=1 Tax=Candidatus Comchoanobacter bicostacola TaxID=2919598 RepID=A0ABY5DJI1_9GAMM|nr:hypothetical protein [Candidatus Comchoanobacter bicostacola]UTC24690.1 hypothetical protein MMH89_00740 [Candidatus Comchoanobacter bicostacola]
MNNHIALIATLITSSSVTLAQTQYNLLDTASIQLGMGVGIFEAPVTINHVQLLGAAFINAPTTSIEISTIQPINNLLSLSVDTDIAFTPGQPILTLGVGSHIRSSKYSSFGLGVGISSLTDQSTDNHQLPIDVTSSYIHLKFSAEIMTQLSSNVYTKFQTFVSPQTNGSDIIMIGSPYSEFSKVNGYIKNVGVSNFGFKISAGYLFNSIS